MNDVPEFFETAALFKLEAEMIADQIRNTKLVELRVLDSIPEQIFQEVVALTKMVCGTHEAILTFVGAEKSFVKAAINTLACGEDREHAFCNHIMHGHPLDEVLIVTNATKDERFAQNPKVLSKRICFYAGAPIVSHDGIVLGALCAIDPEEKVLTDEQLIALKSIANVVTQILVARTVVKT
jgi:GAF domain-containing protein